MVECTSKCKMGEFGWEGIDRLVEIMLESEVSE